MAKSYEKYDVKFFGKFLIESGDLDPVYIALPKAIDNADQLHRWLIAYWCFYSCGFSCWASERKGNDFWECLLLAAENERLSPLDGRWPRGQERRHARGAKGIEMVRCLRNRYGSTPERMVEYLIQGAPTYEGVANRAKEHVLFGDWISFKICDMLERVLSIKIDFSEAHVFMFDDPVKAALMLWRKYHNFNENVKPKNQKEAIKLVVEKLKELFSDFYAPPFRDRAIDLQEIETILCKWKSHQNGHYPLNNDIIEIRKGVEPWVPVSPTALSFLKAMPKEIVL